MTDNTAYWTDILLARFEEIEAEREALLAEQRRIEEKKNRLRLGPKKKRYNMFNRRKERKEKAFYKKKSKKKEK